MKRLVALLLCLLLLTGMLSAAMIKIVLHIRARLSSFEPQDLPVGSEEE